MKNGFRNLMAGRWALLLPDIYGTPYKKNNEAPQSFGFTQDTKNLKKGEITIKDDQTYKAKPTQITIQITQQQYQKLINLGENSEANIYFNPSNYNFLTHSCVEYVFKALELIGYNPFGEEKDLTYPETAFSHLKGLLARYGAIAVEGNKLSPVIEKEAPTSSIGLRDQPFYDDTITGYDNNPDEIYGGAGKDHLIGKSGDDTLNGGKDDDTLEGGEDNDTLNGGDDKGEIRFPDKNYQIADSKPDLNDQQRTENGGYSSVIYLFDLSTSTATFASSEGLDGGYYFEAKGIHLTKHILPNIFQPTP